MSLSPDDYARSIGKASCRCGYATALVYLTELKGGGPSGCDGWALTMSDGLVHGYTGVYPPWCRGDDRSEESRSVCSRELAESVQAIRDEFLRSGQV